MTTNKITPLKTDATITISNLIDQEENYKLNPPYQRNSVWQDNWKIELVQHVLDELPLAPVTLVKKIDSDGDEKFWVLDGKQRLLSILDFIHNKFEIPFIIENNKKVYYSYNDLKKISDDKHDKHHQFIKKQYTSFKNYNLRAVIYPEISWNEQIKLFDRINHSLELSKYEKFNMDYIFVKYFAEHIFNTYAPFFVQKNKPITKITKRGKEKTKDKRGKDLTNQFKLLMCLMGKNIDNIKCSFENLPSDATVNSNTEFKNFMTNLNSKIESYMSEKDDQYLFDNKDRVQEMCNLFKWNKLIQQLKNFDYIYKHLYSIKNKSRSDYFYLYFSIFIIEKIQENVITMNLFNKEKTIIDDIFQNYNKHIEALPKEGDISVSRTGNTLNKKYNMDYIQKLFENSSLDLGIKNQDFTEKEKEQIFLNANGKCEMCNYSSEILVADHIKPKSLSSEKIGGALCPSCNHSKSDITLSDLSKVENYVKKKSNEYSYQEFSI